MVCSSAAVLGSAQNFILYQNVRNSWSYVAGPGKIAEGVALISVGGSVRNNVVGSAIDGTGVFWFQYPGSRNGIWASHYIGSADAGVSIRSITLPDGQAYIVVAANKSAWPGGRALFTQKSDPTQPWDVTTIDPSYRAVHHPSVGTFDGSPYLLAAEQEQACIDGITDNDAYHADLPCRVEIFKYNGGTFEPLVFLTTQGTQNQSVIPYKGGLLIVGANQAIYGGSPSPAGLDVGSSEIAARSSR